MSRVEDYRKAIAKVKDPAAADAVWRAAIEEATAGNDQAALNEILVDHPMVAAQIVGGKLAQSDDHERRQMKERYEWGGGQKVSVPDVEADDA